MMARKIYTPQTRGILNFKIIKDLSYRTWYDTQKVEDRLSYSFCVHLYNNNVQKTPQNSQNDPIQARCCQKSCVW